MGAMFRSYWMPALLAEELPEPGCPPVRIKLLSERLLAFRDSEGRLGLIDEFCAHRGVSLWFGRNEHNVACVAPTTAGSMTTQGQCMDVPSEPSREWLCARSIKLEVVSAGRAAVACCGPTWVRPRASNRRCRSGSSPPSPASHILHRRSGCRSATGCRRWRAASIRATSPSCIPDELNTDPLFKGSRRATSTTSSDMKPRVRGGRESRVDSTSARAATPRTGQLLLARHAMGDAMLSR